ncbi:polysaccharide biosynthesis/export family protein [Sphingomonas sanguinis]|mgnify:CR=1 FL=1|jgi:protein involved in polysaccharide export with SLBB domain|uniref:Polysaccharide export protein n=1 Tax=Sphingomonas sanguinis TaxID=33051 RepID=A0A7Y7USQ0_9SPHN|nr:polysaccharide biosynthesis/export family protein [Sphingomonas sanguinis]MBZ6382903.1 polysaccharide export protein [Sphingomonas sanguinis]NNG51514.1 polysaccharide export protein [Sphingomonas sanguinis]NNG52457.1 polysaccharide export protein [Sphingomonas sanguinis]NVP32203.1 polysaccharide export protein [Sphingomonas sanguinis]
MRFAKFFLLLIGCTMPAMAQTAAGSGSAPARQVDAGPAAESSGDYRLGTADKVRVIVYNEPTLSGEFTVSDNGTLSLPLIGDVPANGRSPREVASDIQAKLADGYLREPRVSLDVLTYRPFYILGEVTKPGEYAYSNGLTALNAVARAQGFTYRANKRKVYLKRAGESAEKEVNIDGLEIRPGDTLRIGERYF